MDFDEVIDRKNTWSLKWDNPKNELGKPDIIPLWVADMDFAPPDCVIDALNKRVEHPIFGYTKTPKEYFETVSAWYSDRHGLEVCPNNIVLAPGMMASISASIQAFTCGGDGVIILTPVYFPFFSVIRDNRRKVIEAPLSCNPDGCWKLDLAAIEEATRKASSEGIRARAMLLSSPHNPVGRVWTCSELSSLLEFAGRNDIMIISDEIHGDIILPPNKFKSFACAEGRDSSGIVVLGGPNKTFNLAGLHLSHAVIREGETRRAFKQALAAWGFSEPNVFSIIAALAAYRGGSAWLDEFIHYIECNYHFLIEFLSTRFPSVKVSPLEGSYLALLDMGTIIKEGSFADDKDLAGYLEDKGRVKLSEGSRFGRGGANRLRINLACPRSTLGEGLERMERALASR